jgi:chromosome segregation ATPase
VEDEEFNLLVDENEDLKNVNKDLVNKINALKKQMKILNNNQNDINTNKLKEEISILNKKYNKICSELNQYKEKNSQLNVQIRNLKNGHK